MASLSSYSTTQLNILLWPPSLIPSLPPLGVPSAPPLVSSVSPLPHALASPFVILAHGCAGELQGHRLLPHGPTRGDGAGGTAAGAGEARAGGAVGTLRICPRPPPEHPSGRSGRSRRRSALRRGVRHGGLPNGGSGRREDCSLDSCTL